MFLLSRNVVRFGLLFAALTLSACAGSIADPVATQALAPAQQQSLHVSEVAVEAQPGVAIAPYEVDRLIYKIKREVGVLPQGAGLANNADPADGVKMKVVLTQYDKGNAFARFTLIGLGQIHIDADVIFLDKDGRTVGKYQVSKQFALGGIYGGSTSVEDVEEGFAKSVAAILQTKA